MPKQFQTFPPAQKFIVVFRNSDYIGGSYNAQEVILEDRNRTFINGEQTECAKAATKKFNDLIGIYDKQIQAANDARAAKLLDIFIQMIQQLILEVSGADLWLAIDDIIAELWQNTNGYVLAAGGFIPMLPDFNDPSLPLGWEGTPYWPDDMDGPVSVPDSIDDVPGQPKPTPSQPGKPPKPPKPPRDPSKIGQWLKNNWRKIIGKIPVKSIWDLILKIAQRVGKWGAVGMLILGIIGVYAWQFIQEDATFNQEIAEANALKEKARKWLDDTLACCRRAAECGSDGKGCNTEFVPYPSEIEPQPKPNDGCPQIG